jgi:hypothetical protein
VWPGEPPAEDMAETLLAHRATEALNRKRGVGYLAIHHAALGPKRLHVPDITLWEGERGGANLQAVVAIELEDHAWLPIAFDKCRQSLRLGVAEAFAHCPGTDVWFRLDSPEGQPLPTSLSAALGLNLASFFAGGGPG